MGFKFSSELSMGYMMKMTMNLLNKSILHRTTVGFCCIEGGVGGFCEAKFLMHV